MARVCRVVHGVQSRAALSPQGPTTAQGRQIQDEDPDSSGCTCEKPFENRDRLSVNVLFARCFKKRDLTVSVRAGPLV
jgi:hypothetical protein